MTPAPASSSPAALPQDRGPKRYSIGDTVIETPRLAGGLYVVATPIGNLGDMTLRALATLAGADLIACEDTRVTRRLLDRYGITTPLAAYHDHNAAKARPALLGRLAEGGAVALVSDAGTPLVSDPGYKLVCAARDAGHSVTALPGASALLAALAVAGLPTDQFLFAGFLPPKQAARRARIAELAAIPSTIVLFESGPRLAATLGDLAAALGPRDAAVCRELTKLHEEVRRDSLSALAQTAETSELRGEFALVIGPPSAAERPSADDAEALLREALKKNSLKDAVAQISEATSLPRRQLYQQALELTKQPANTGARSNRGAPR